MKVTIIRKNIKNMYLRLGEGDSVTVTAPHSVPREEVLNFVKSREKWILRARKRQEEKKLEAPDYLEHPELKEKARRELRARLEERVPRMEAITGLKCSGWQIRDMKTLWGSCNTRTHHLNFNLRLVNRSDEELDYVILHELCHTVNRYHDRKFWDLVGRYMPDWKRIRKNLKGNW